MMGALCVCALLPEPRLETRTRVALFIHRYEARKPTNTGLLATECLANSEVFIRGRPSEPTPPFLAPPGTVPVLLFPHAGAILLDELADRGAPVTLIVPDGSWRQASKVQHRVPGLRDVACAWLPEETPSRYRLRHEAHITGLATIEAIARALGILEGPEVRAALERVFFAMVERTLLSRGLLDVAHMEEPIPEGFEPSDLRVRRSSARVRESS